MKTESKKQKTEISRAGFYYCFLFSAFCF